MLLFQGNNTERFNKTFTNKGFEVDIDTSVITSKAQYLTALNKTVDLTKKKNNINAAVFVAGTYPTLKYGDLSLKHHSDSDAARIANILDAPSIYQFRLWVKPTKVYLKATFYNGTGPNAYAVWGLKVTGETTNTVSVPLMFIDYAGYSTYLDRPYHGIWANNATTKVGTYTGGSGNTYWDQWFDLTVLSPDCFKTEEKSYLVDYVSISTLGGEAIDSFKIAKFVIR